MEHTIEIPEPTFTYELDWSGSVLEYRGRNSYRVKVFANGTLIWAKRYSNSDTSAANYAADNADAVECSRRDFGKWLVEKIGTSIEP